MFALKTIVIWNDLKTIFVFNFLLIHNNISVKEQLKVIVRINFLLKHKAHKSKIAKNKKK